jgi:flagellar biosynthesis/type III secretory pathway protein FliH
MPLAPAVTEAVRSCVRDGILADFLEEHGSEVLNMLLEEWNWEEAKEVWWEEAMEKGMEEGMEKGMEKGRKEGMEKSQNQILELIEQGYTMEQLKTKLAEGLQNRR